MWPFREGAGPYAMTEAMTGVRLGERLIYLGAGDPAMFAALAAKVGVTGRACALVESETASDRVKRAAVRAGVLVEVAVVDFASLALDEGTFDVAVIDATAGVVLTWDQPRRTAVSAGLLRALRPRGRAIVIEREKAGLMAVFTPRLEDRTAFRAQDGATTLLQAGGFQPVRVLADLRGERFTEGWKKSV